ncbi:MAG: ABC transporter ATP-binding protein [Planctomycetaceae bacterium]|nr:ABC transporter ATP-binding protein [Planctomycetaceae bacterium]
MAERTRSIMSELVVEHVTKRYTTPAEDLVVLEDASLQLKQGENAAIIGPSGSGKSTLLHILGALDSPTSGTVKLGGVSPFGLSPNDLADFRNQKIGFIFQDHHLLPQLTVLENVLIPVLAHGRPKPDMVERARELIAKVGLQHRESHLPSELSGGERGRAAVARALIHRPLLVLADEPTGNLDPENATRIGELLMDLPRSENSMLVVVTHSQTLASLAQHCFRIEKGRLISGTWK